MKKFLITYLIDVYLHTTADILTHLNNKYKCLF